VRGISVGSANNAGATPGIGAKEASVTTTGPGCCHGVSWGVVGRSGVLAGGLSEARRSNKFILDSLFLSEVNFEALLGAGDGDGDGEGGS